MRTRRRSFGLALGWILCGVLALLAWREPPDGHDRAAAAQFLGRFHPVIVHLPIALMLLVPVLELAGRNPKRAHLRAAAEFVLVLTAIASLVVAFDGWLLGRSGGYRGHTVNAHLWGGVVFAALCMAAVGLRRPDEQPASALYAGSLVACLAALLWTSHLGGTLSHGEGYLTRYFPFFRAERRPAAAPAALPAKAPPTFYAARIQPILNRSCVSCHGPTKVKGSLRLDTYAQLMDGGEDGPVVTPWLPQESELVRRITLPPDDDDFMPNNGKNLLTPAEIRLFEEWIAAGASNREPAEPARFPAPAS